MGRCSQCRSQSATEEEEEKEDRHPSPAAGREGEPPTAGFYQDSCRAWRNDYCNRADNFQSPEIIYYSINNHARYYGSHSWQNVVSYQL